MYIEAIQTMHSVVAAMPAVENPIDGVVPNFTVFGAEFNSWWQKLFAAVWALAIIYAIVMLVISIATMAQAKGGHPQELSESRRSAAISGVALAILAGFGVVVGAVLAVAG